MRDDQTGPWVLALATLLLGLGAVTVTLLRWWWNRRANADRAPRDPGRS